MGQAGSDFDRPKPNLQIFFQAWAWSVAYFFPGLFKSMAWKPIYMPTLN